MIPKRPLAALIATLFLAAPLPAQQLDDPPEQVFRAYLDQPRPDSGWRLVSSHAGEGGIVDVLELSSQHWLDEEMVDRTEWRHWLEIVRPAELKTRTGLLFITGGRNRPDPPEEPRRMAVEFARQTGSVCATLRNVPNQPLRFANDTKTMRSEDSLLAHSWNLAMESGDPHQVAQLAMTRSAVAAMDAIQQYLHADSSGRPMVEHFFVTGASKRGWTTWLTAAMDPRVVGCAPAVIDLLNIENSMRHHYAAYGFWSPALNDYVENGIVERLDDPALEAVLRLVDPLNYRQNLTMPKYLLNAAGDQFFLPDSWRFYYEQLPGPKYLRYVPNTGHGLDDSDAAQGLLAFYGAVAHGLPLPRFDWSSDEEGRLEARCGEGLLELRLWWADAPERRDFRIDRLGPAWQSRPLEPESPGLYRTRVEAPPSGWRAAMLEARFQGPAPDLPFIFTTGILVRPDTLPHANSPLLPRLEPREE